MGKVLGFIYRTIATHLTHKAGYTKTTAHTGAFLHTGPARIRQHTYRGVPLAVASVPPLGLLREARKRIYPLNPSVAVAKVP